MHETEIKPGLLASQANMLSLKHSILPDLFFVGYISVSVLTPPSSYRKARVRRSAKKARNTRERRSAKTARNTHVFVRRVDEDHFSHLGVVGAGSDECADG